MDLAGTLNTVFGVLALVAAGISTLLFGSLKAVRDSNTDLRARSSDQDVKISAMSALIETLRADNDALQRTIRGDDHFDALGVKVDQLTARQTEHNEGAVEHWRNEIVLLTAVKDALSRRAEGGL